MVPRVPQTGDVVAGKYEIRQMLGKGGMGIVFEAQHKKLGTRVAIKFLMPDALTSHDGVARFDREARASALLRSPYVVRVLDIDATVEGLPFIVMEYLQGVDLGSETRRRGTIPLSEAIDWVLQACIGLAEAHARGIVHRDIKPANLYLCTEATGSVVKVMDFGVSKLLAGHTEIDLTTTETTVGTPNYMAPEQLLSSKSIDHRADVWALGVVLYRMLAGTFPFSGTSPTALAIAIATKPPVHLAMIAPSLPPDVVAAVMRALEKTPDKRHPDMVAFGRALEPFGTKRVGFAAAVANMPPPHAAGSSGRLPSIEDTATVAMDVTSVVADDMNAGTSKAWSQRAVAKSGTARRSSAPIVVGVLAVVVILLGLAGATIALRSGPQGAASRSATSAAPIASAEGAFAPPPASPEPAAAAPVVSGAGSAALAASASHGLAHAAPVGVGRGPLPRGASSTPKPARSAPQPAAPPDDPLHL